MVGNCIGLNVGELEFTSGSVSWICDGGIEGELDGELDGTGAGVGAEVGVLGAGANRKTKSSTSIYGSP